MAIGGAAAIFLTTFCTFVLLFGAAVLRHRGGQKTEAERPQPQAAVQAPPRHTSLRTSVPAVTFIAACAIISSFAAPPVTTTRWRRALPCNWQQPAVHADFSARTHHGSFQSKLPASATAAAQRLFDAALLLTISFNHAQATRLFKAALATDSTCALCAWGIAFSAGPNINRVRPSTLASSVLYLRLCQLPYPDRQQVR